MAAVSVQLERGKSGTKLVDFVVGAAAPTSLDFEVRWNLTDTNGAALTKKELFFMLEAVERFVVQALQSPAGTPLLAGPVL